MSVINMKAKLKAFLAASMGVGILTSCGQGIEPIGNLGDSSLAAGPGLALPLVPSNNSYTFSSFTPYSQVSGNLYWGMQSASFVPQSTAVYAPGTGFVIAAETASQTVKILHNQHIYSMVIGVLPSGITAGSYVTAQSQIGTIPTSLSNNLVKFYVYVDGIAVCPLSYLSSAARGQLTSFFYGSFYNYQTNPCQQ